MKRYFEIRNYRNFGIDGKEEIVINNSLIKGEMGNVVTLIGENNLGKSSVLKAFKKYHSNSLNRNEDIYDNSYGALKLPELTLCVTDDEEEFRHMKTIGKQDDSNGYEYTFLNDDKYYDSFFELMKKIEQIFQTENQNYNNSFWNKINAYLEHSKSFENVQKLKSAEPNIYSTMYNELQYILNNIESNDEEIYKTIVNEKINVDELLKFYDVQKQSLACNMKNRFREKYGYDLEPRVFEYTGDNKIVDGDLCSTRDFSDGSIISIVLNYIGFTKNDVNLAYERFSTNNSMAPLKNFQKEVNRKMCIIDETFNSVFRTNTTSYSFKFEFTDVKIRLIICCGEKELIINRNSEGFKWFFNFFFNFILKYDFKPGDIILMDDQGYGLMPQGIYELHRYLQEYAKQKDLTFILATCNEHFVDLNYLEEIRIINRIDNDKAQIINMVTLFNEGDIDALKQIKKAIMVNGNIFDDDEVQHVYVEKTLIYNYLTAFCILFDIKNLTFIPFDSMDLKTAEVKLRRRNHRNIFLVDGSEESIKLKDYISENTDSIVISINEVDKNLVTFEDLFSDDEIKLFNISEKSYFKSCNFKQNIKKYCEKISYETKERFKKLLDFIIE